MEDKDEKRRKHKLTGVSREAQDTVRGINKANKAYDQQTIEEEP